MLVVLIVISLTKPSLMVIFRLCGLFPVTSVPVPNDLLVLSLGSPFASNPPPALADKPFVLSKFVISPETLPSALLIIALLSVKLTLLLYLFSSNSKAVSTLTMLSTIFLNSSAHYNIIFYLLY